MGVETFLMGASDRSDYSISMGRPRKKIAPPDYLESRVPKKEMEEIR